MESLVAMKRSGTDGASPSSSRDGERDRGASRRSRDRRPGRRGARGVRAPAPRGDGRRAARASGRAHATRGRSRWRRRSASSGRRRGCTAGAGASSRGSGRRPASAASACRSSSPRASRKASPSRTRTRSWRSSGGPRSEVEARLDELEDAKTLDRLLLYLRRAVRSYRLARSCGSASPRRSRPTSTASR